MINTRELWDKLETKRQYVSFVGKVIKQYGIDFNIEYDKGTYRGNRKIDFKMDKQDWELIVGDLKRLESRDRN